MNNEETMEKKDVSQENQGTLVYGKPMLTELHVAPNVVSGLSNFTEGNEADTNYVDEAGDN